MAYIDFMSSLHRATKRDYLARVNDPEFPKAKAARLAKRWGVDYWDGDRRINYGGYKYIPGRWTPLAQQLIEHYKLKPGDCVLDIGCGKGFLLFELKQLIPELQIFGLDISSYAIENSKEEVRDSLHIGSAASLPYAASSMDLVLSINTLHNLRCYDLEKALHEISRVMKEKAYICVESYRNEEEKANLLYWQVTCESFYATEEWQWWMLKTNYFGDYSFIYFG